MDKNIYDVIQITFNDPTNFPTKVIATCKSRQLAQCVIARCNTSFHSFKIVERAPEQ